MSNYATKFELKKATGVETSNFAEKIDLVCLKSCADELNIDKLQNVPSGLDSLRIKVDKLDVDKLVPVSTDLKN